MKLSPAEVRRVLIGSLRPSPGGPEALRALGCVQLDPIDRIGTNADLVFHARVAGWRRGDWGRMGGTFEHWAKERCLLPESAFPHYRDRVVQTPWWRLGEREARLDPAIIEAVHREVAERGPLSPRQLGDHGRVEALNWDGWKGTPKAGSMALEVLWTRCRVVVSGRTPTGDRIYDLPERALPERAAAPAQGDFLTWAMGERVKAARLLPTRVGPWWGNLKDHRDFRQGLVEVEVGSRSYLTTEAILEEPAYEDDRLRILGPLDPVIWDRELVRAAFDFDYTWDVYKPASQRQFGWYTCPVLHRGALRARIEAVREGGEIRVLGLWGEVDRLALEAELQDLALMNAGRASTSATASRAGSPARRRARP